MSPQGWNRLYNSWIQIFKWFVFHYLFSFMNLKWELYLAKSPFSRITILSPPKGWELYRLNKTSTSHYQPELDRIIRIIRYSNSWDRIVLFVFGIRSICEFRIIFEYPNSCHRILNSSRIFYKKDMCRKHSKNLSCRYENKGSNFPHLIWSQNSHIKFFGGLLFDFKYSVFE